MANKSKLGFLSFVISCLIFITISFLTESCADDPSSVGIRFISPNETLGVKIFDSYVDTMQITTTNFRQYVNNASSGNLLVGRNPSYLSMGFLKFTNLSTSYDSAVVNWAIIKLKYRNYYFPQTHADSLGQIAFNFYRLKQDLNFSTITYDSINSSLYENVLRGSYTGSPTYDTAEVNIPIDTALVRNWLKYASGDTANTLQNYGLILMPNGGSNTLKAFYASNASQTERPILQVSVTKNNKTDTLNIDQSQTVFLASTSFGEIPEIFKLQGGISYVDIIKFNTSKFSTKTIVNDAEIILTLDTTRCVFSNQVIKQIQAFYVTDTLNNIESVIFSSSQAGNKLNLRVIAPFQRWIEGQNNFGLILRVTSQFSNLDLFAVYNETALDPNNRPRVIIRYSLRIP